MEIKEFIKLLKEEFDEWEKQEKKYPHIPTRISRLRNRINKLSDDALRGKQE